MNRIDRIFKDLASQNRKTVMPFLTAGDPDLNTTGLLLEAAQRAGAHICELGIPFSDPIADGSVIQASMTHALDHQNIRPQQVFDLVSKYRAKLELGLVAMVSYSIVHRIGAERFISDAKSAGLDGFIFPDLPVDEAPPVVDLVAKYGLICSLLIAPTTPIYRAERIAQASTGFIYVLSRSGITGEKADVAKDLQHRITRLRAVTDLPIAVGFGISSAGHVAEVVKLADAAIVGSAIMRRVADHRQTDLGGVTKAVEQFIRDLAAGLSNKATAT